MASNLKILFVHYEEVGKLLVMMEKNRHKKNRLFIDVLEVYHNKNYFLTTIIKYSSPSQFHSNSKLILYFSSTCRNHHPYVS